MSARAHTDESSAAAVRPALLADGRGVLYRALAVVLTELVYVPILGNYFHADDFYYLYVLNDHRPLEFLLTPHGGHMLLLRNAVFALCHALFGTDPRGYFVLVLLTHLVNVLLLYALIRALTTSDRLACFGSALWGMSPVNEGSLGWYSVYGHVLATTLVLWVLWQVVRAARTPGTTRWWAPCLWYVALVGASTAFGVGMAVAIVFPVVLMLLLPGPRFRLTRWVFWSLPALVFGLYRLLLWLHTVVTAHFDPTVFGLLDIAIKLWQVIPPTAIHLVNVGVAHLAFGPFNPAAPYPSPIAYATALLFYGSALAAALFGGPARRRALIACGLIAAAAYGMIAVGRGPMLPSMALSPAAAATWPRYQYLGMVPLAVMACLIFDWLGSRLSLRASAADGLLAAWVAIAAAAYLRSGHTIQHYDRDRAETTAFLNGVSSLVDAQRDDAGPVYIRNRFFRSIDYMGVQWTVFPGWAAMFVAYFPDDVVGGKRVFFLEDAAVGDLIRQARPGTRTASLLTSEEAHPIPTSIGSPEPSPRHLEATPTMRPSSSARPAKRPTRRRAQ